MAMLHAYIDTSVIGGYFDPEFKEYSIQLFNEFTSGRKIVVVSDLLLFELEEAPEKVKEILKAVPKENIEHAFLNEESIALANIYVKEAAIPEKSLLDARHIAIATVERADILLSWNFKHIVNIATIRLINSVNMKLVPFQVTLFPLNFSKMSQNIPFKPFYKDESEPKLLETALGYPVLEIRSPREVLYEEEV